jgi:magnesium transporter
VTKIIWYVLHTYDRPALDLFAEVDNYEEKIFLRTLTPKMMEDLYYIKRKADLCNKLLVLTGEVISTVPVSKKDAIAFRDVQDLHIKLRSLYTQIHDDVAGLLNIYLSLSSQKTNEVMKILTIFSVFFMPLTFIVGIYGMNFKYMPELEARWGYPAVFIVMAVISVLIYVWFKKKKWL